MALPMDKRVASSWLMAAACASAERTDCGLVEDLRADSSNFERAIDRSAWSCDRTAYVLAF